jgi:hypothetical protein
LEVAGVILTIVPRNGRPYRSPLPPARMWGASDAVMARLEGEMLLWNLPHFIRLVKAFYDNPEHWELRP